MIIWLVLIWATAVFGFQVLLKIVQKPVKEPAYVSFEAVWSNIEAETASLEETKIFANSVLTVLGKVYIKSPYKVALQNAFSWSVYRVADKEQETLHNLLLAFEKTEAESESIYEQAYLEAKKELENYVVALLGVSENDPRRISIPFSLKADEMTLFVDKDIVDEAMSRYLIHNRSFLTDTKFLGFPFHYFYTAVFLLCLFIGLCWIYCILTDKREAKEQLS